MGNIKALSFDMYKTLIDTKDFHEQAVKEILKMNNADSVNPDLFHSRWDEIYDDVYLALKEKEFVKLYEVSIESLRLTMKELGVDGDPEIGVELWLKKYEKADLFSEVEEVFDILSKRCPIVITSNVDDDDLGYAMFKQKNLPVIDIITSESSKSYKPNGKIFDDALAVLKCNPENVLHIGDSQTADVYGGKKAGMLTAWINRPPVKNIKQGIPKPDYEIADLRELLDIVD